MSLSVTGCALRDSLQSTQADQWEILQEIEPMVSAVREYVPQDYMDEDWVTVFEKLFCEIQQEAAKTSVPGERLKSSTDLKERVVRHIVDAPAEIRCHMILRGLLMSYDPSKEQISCEEERRRKEAFDLTISGGVHKVEEAERTRRRSIFW